VSASEIIKELPKLSEAERRAVLEKLRELAVQDENSIELYSAERIAEFESAEKELQEFFRRKGLR
jgi:mRNA-degrading endonuclease RelE of RelBE toxin-antitoxin system